MSNNNVSKRIIKDAIKHSLLPLVLLTLLGIALSICGVFFAVVSKAVLDSATGGVQGNIAKPVLILVALIAAQLAMQVLFSSISVSSEGRLNKNIKKRFFSQILNKDYLQISRYHSGDLLNRMSGDIGSVASGIINIIPETVSQLVRLLLGFFVLFRLDSTVALICLLAGPVVIVVSKIYRDKMKALHKKCQETKGKSLSFMQECLQNIMVVKSFSGEKQFTSRAIMLEQDYLTHIIRRNNISIIANVLFYISITAVYYFALAWGAYKISKGLMTFGTLTAVLQLTGQIQGPFRGLSSLLPKYFALVASCERLAEITALDSEIKSKEIDYKSLYRDMSCITLENVSFSYDEKPILKNASLNIEKGDLIAISAGSGIGKSTFLKLLLGIIRPLDGRIYIKLENGTSVPVDKNIRPLFAYVPQGNMVLSGTIRENIVFAQEDVDEEKIIESAKISAVWDFIGSLPQGLDTVIGEKGLGLSEGQVQRIAVARAIYSDSPIILLDEATSALDEETEKVLLQNIKNMKEKTCIIVSHRKAVFEICR
ncbi:MAG: ABC transporter ATP-binding protein, partial [Eubacteriales bacterium]|nr:ABC transporter ATP-binding protein [Eubacteriales bacterium]